MLLCLILLWIQGDYIVSEWIIRTHKLHIIVAKQRVILAHMHTIRSISLINSAASSSYCRTISNFFQFIIATFTVSLKIGIGLNIWILIKKTSGLFRSGPQTFWVNLMTHFDLRIALSFYNILRRSSCKEQIIRNKFAFTILIPKIVFKSWVYQFSETQVYWMVTTGIGQRSSMTLCCCHMLDKFRFRRRSLLILNVSQVSIGRKLLLIFNFLSHQSLLSLLNIFHYLRLLIHKLAI